jgi:hypothetical protein
MKQLDDWDLFMCDLFYHNYVPCEEGAERNDNDGYLHMDYINPTNFFEAVATYMEVT